MPRLQTSFVLGYHGCDASVGEKVLAGEADLLKSDKDYDWLGPGAYFWESDPLRAWEWAERRAAMDKIANPFVIGAAIDLGNCLDLLARESLELLAVTYQHLVELISAAKDGRVLPENGKDDDKLLRYLDCAVIRLLHAALEEREEAPFDTVRGLFTEGGHLYPGSGFKAKTHVQIAVCKPSSIKGYFRVPRPAS
jgi:hypothetical protein